MINMPLLKEITETATEEDGDYFFFDRVRFLLKVGMGHADILSADRNDLDTVVSFLANEYGGCSEDYYEIWKDIVAHVEAGEE
jgi:hypothetical protein